MAWSRSSRAVLRLTPEQVWSVLGDPTRWPEWNPAMAEVTMSGPAALGAKGFLVPAHPLIGPVHRRTAPDFEITDYAAAQRLTITQPQPGGELVFTWTVEPDAPGHVVLRQRVDITGPLATGFAPFAGVPSSRAFPEQAARLHALVPDAPVEPLRVVIAGGSGALGRRLAADLTCRGHDVVILTRGHDARMPFRQVSWDGRTVGAWPVELEPASRTALVNLAGRLVDVRPSAANVASLRESRVDSTRALVEASRGLSGPLAHWVQASTTAIWSDAGETRCDETTPVPLGLPQMTGVAQPWERAFDGAHTDHGVVLRTSLVLDRDVPVVDRLAGVTRLGLGGRIADGRQWMSWIHVEDWLAVVRAALGLTPGLALPAGVVVASSPEPARNAELMQALRRVLGRPWAPPTPALAVRLGGIPMRTDPALALTGRHATSTVLREAGFEFAFPRVEDALHDLLG